MSASVGQLAWAARTGGRLSWQDRLSLQIQAVQLQLARAARRWWERRDSTQTDGPLDWANISDLRVPDSTLARRALACAAELSAPWLLNHCLRTWVWSEILARRHGQRIDHELLFVAAILHDLGLTTSHDGVAADCHCFAVEGAHAAHQFVLNAGADHDLADAVAEAIALHLNPRVPASQGMEAHFLHAGAALDVVGVGIKSLPHATVAAVVACHPWLDFGARMAEATHAQAMRRPHSRAAFLAEHGFIEMIRAMPRSPAHAR